MISIIIKNKQCAAEDIETAIPQPEMLYSKGLGLRILSLHIILSVSLCPKFE
jgi:hypothetical protein